MLVCNENEKDISVITGHYYSVLIISFIFSMTGIFYWDEMRFKGTKIFKNSCPVL